MRKLSSGEEKAGPKFLSRQALQSLFDFFFLPSFTFPSRKLRVQPNSWLSISLHQQISVPLLAQITSTTEQISPGSSVVYWQPPPLGHKPQFLGVERDSLSSAACPKKCQVSFFLPRSFISAEYAVWLSVGGF